MIELKLKDRRDLDHLQFGKIETSTEVSIPEGCVGIVGVRQSYGDRGIFLTSPILWSGFTGCPRLYVTNHGGTKIELIQGEVIAHVAIVKAENLEGL